MDASIAMGRNPLGTLLAGGHIGMVKRYRAKETGHARGDSDQGTTAQHVCVRERGGPVWEGGKQERRHCDHCQAELEEDREGAETTAEDGSLAAGRRQRGRKECMAKGGCRKPEKWEGRG